ncbi:MAG: RNA polymerase subunit sigma-70 [Cytophagaceae bacterium]|nr:RNA polymerase subunit sigma-70 [Gemmatimonadaceae bacterium]
MPDESLAPEAREVADAVARRSYGKLVAFLAARTRDVAAAEDALSEAFAAALIEWPTRGPPDNPEAWLLTVARRRQMDLDRRQGTHDTAARELAILAEGLETHAELPGIPDRRLALMFACAHPAIEAAVRAPLMLQVVVGLDAKAIAPPFLLSPAAMSKRLVRAKIRIREAGIPFRIPEPEELPARVDAVLDAVYATFTEGWTDPRGTDAIRRHLTGEAFFLARLLVELLPDEPEAMGLLALVLHAEARRAARRDEAGEFVPLDRQDAATWDWRMIAEAEALLRRAATSGAIGRYQLEGALQSAHVHRLAMGASNWADIVRLHDGLLAITGSPVVALNRALAIGELKGPAEALLELDTLATDARLAQYQPWWEARAEVLARMGDTAGARAAYALAIGLERDPAVRRFLQHARERLHR